MPGFQTIPSVELRDSFRRERLPTLFESLPVDPSSQINAILLRSHWHPKVTVAAQVRACSREALLPPEVVNAPDHSQVV